MVVGLLEVGLARRVVGVVLVGRVARPVAGGRHRPRSRAATRRARPPSGCGRSRAPRRPRRATRDGRRPGRAGGARRRARRAPWRRRSRPGSPPPTHHSAPGGTYSAGGRAVEDGLADALVAPLAPSGAQVHAARKDDDARLARAGAALEPRPWGRADRPRSRRSSTRPTPASPRGRSRRRRVRRIGREASTSDAHAIVESQREQRQADGGAGARALPRRAARRARRCQTSLLRRLLRDLRPRERRDRRGAARAPRAPALPPGPQRAGDGAHRRPDTRGCEPARHARLHELDRPRARRTWSPAPRSRR